MYCHIARRSLLRPTSVYQLLRVLDLGDHIADLFFCTVKQTDQGLKKRSEGARKLATPIKKQRNSYQRMVITVNYNFMPLS